jgi:hypothetical protein
MSEHLQKVKFFEEQQRFKFYYFKHTYFGEKNFKIFSSLFHRTVLQIKNNLQIKKQTIILIPHGPLRHFSFPFINNFCF